MVGIASILHYLNLFTSSVLIVDLDVQGGTALFEFIWLYKWIANSMIVKEVSKSVFKYIWFLSLDCEILDMRNLYNKGCLYYQRILY